MLQSMRSQRVGHNLVTKQRVLGTSEWYLIWERGLCRGDEVKNLRKRDYPGLSQFKKVTGWVCKSEGGEAWVFSEPCLSSL